jgi:hypothetical protein
MSGGTPVNVDRLCALLDEETRAAEALAAVLREERDAMVRLEADALLECLARRQARQDELGAVARRRQVFVAEACGADVVPPRVGVLVATLSAPARQRVRECVRRLRRSLLAARGGERQTQALARASLDTNAELLHALQALLPGTRYGADARLAPPTLVESLDRRA